MDVYFRKIEADGYNITETKIKYCRPCATHHDIEDFAVIDVERIIESCDKNNLDFDLFFSTCISHELIHSIIERDMSLDLSYKFDNLYQMLKSKKSPFHELGTGL